MAIDYIIGALQLLSAAVNVLALGSFWITPGLRTTANRFVINLLFVNIVGCLALTPALWLHGGLIPTVHQETQSIYDNDVEFTSTSSPVSTLQDDFDFGSTINPTIFLEIFATKQIYEQNSVDDVEIIADIREDEHNIQQNQSHNQANQTWSPTKNIQYSDCTRFWGFDLVAALGKFTLISYICLFFSKIDPRLSIIMKN